ncbi:hypothetical protein [Streptomyces longisporoflavus]|uniref:DUF4280 domain-containing protein n=1 Tax=Streptomyces longisporoflavus TaxID=28044 RepID=A0ABW7QFX4_9ACTN
MPGHLLHEGITIVCPHGGNGRLTPSSTLLVGGQKAAVAQDPTTVSGCAFNVGGTPSPCLRVEWQRAATKVTAGGKAVLLSDSVALCVNAAGAPQGTARVSGFQTKVKAI